MFTTSLTIPHRSAFNVTLFIGIHFYSDYWGCVCGKWVGKTRENTRPDRFPDGGLWRLHWSHPNHFSSPTSQSFLFFSIKCKKAYIIQTSVMADDTWSILMADFPWTHKAAFIKASAFKVINQCLDSSAVLMLSNRERLGFFQQDFRLLLSFPASTYFLHSLRPEEPGQIWSTPSRSLTSILIPHK